MTPPADEHEGTSLAERMAQVPLFHTPPLPDRRLIAAIGIEERYAAGAVIYHQGVVARDIFVVTAGEVHTPTSTQTSIEQVVRSFAAYGVSSLMEPLRYRRDVVPSLVDSDDAIGRRLWWEVARELIGRVRALLVGPPVTGGYDPTDDNNPRR